MDSTTAGLIAGGGLLVAVLALLAAFWVARAARRRTDRQIEQLQQAQAALDAHLVQAAVPAIGGPVSPAQVAVASEDEIIDAVLVEEPDRVPYRAATGGGLARSPRPEELPDRRIDVRAAADLVARVALVRSVAVVHGFKHAVSGETRSRIRYAMKREVKRSRRDRKDEVKIAVREYRARQREQDRARIAEHDRTGENGA